MQVQTHHQIVAADQNKMELVCFVCGPTPHQIVSANRSEGGWVVTADGADDVTVASRDEAIDAMLETATAVLPDGGYSTLIPRGLRDLP